MYSSLLFCERALDLFLFFSYSFVAHTIRLFSAPTTVSFLRSVSAQKSYPQVELNRAVQLLMFEFKMSADSARARSFWILCLVMFINTDVWRMTDVIRSDSSSTQLQVIREVISISRDVVGTSSLWESSDPLSVFSDSNSTGELLNDNFNKLWLTLRDFHSIADFSWLGSWLKNQIQILSHTTSRVSYGHYEFDIKS